MITKIPLLEEVLETLRVCGIDETKANEPTFKVLCFVLNDRLAKLESDNKTLRDEIKDILYTTALS